MKKKVILSLIVFLLLAAAAAFAVGWFSHISEVRVEGGVFYSDGEIIERVFYDEASRRPLVALWREMTGKKVRIPFVEDYSVSLDGLGAAQITVKPKSMAARVDFMDSRLYFDMNGLVVESSPEIYPGIPRVTGLDIDYVVLGKTLPVSSRTVLSQLLQVTQFLSSRSIEWDGQDRLLINIMDRIHFDGGGQIWLYADKLSVLLGTGSQLEGKLPVMADILPQLYGREGTLHLESFDFNSDDQTYRFY